MSEKDKTDQRNMLNEALKDSFRKMLDLKKRLGQPIVTVGSEGNPVIISAAEAEMMIDKE